MTAHRLSEDEIDVILAQRRKQAKAKAAGRSHRALPLDEVERRARAARQPWPACSGTCSQGCEPCSCPTAGASSVSGIEHEAPYNQSRARPRMGRLSLAERVLLSRRPTYTWAAVVLFAVLCAVQWVRS